jgi:hypothetical protein
MHDAAIIFDCGEGDMEDDNECSVHGPFVGQVCVSCATIPPDNECNLHGAFHGMVCEICFGIAKGAEILASNPPDEVDHTYTGTLEREIERLLRERGVLQSRVAALEGAVEWAIGGYADTGVSRGLFCSDAAYDSFRDELRRKAKEGKPR